MAKNNKDAKVLKVRTSPLGPPRTRDNEPHNPGRQTYASKNSNSYGGREGRQLLWLETGETYGKSSTWQSGPSDNGKASDHVSMHAGYWSSPGGQNRQGSETKITGMSATTARPGKFLYDFGHGTKTSEDGETAEYGVCGWSGYICPDRDEGYGDTSDAPAASVGIEHAYVMYRSDATEAEWERAQQNLENMEKFLINLAEFSESIDGDIPFPGIEWDQITSYEDLQDALIEVRVWLAEWLDEVGQDYNPGDSNITPEDTDLVDSFTNPQRLERFAETKFDSSPQGRVALQFILELFRNNHRDPGGEDTDYDINMDYIDELFEEQDEINGVDLLNWMLDAMSSKSVKERYGRGINLQDLIDTKNGENAIDWTEASFFTWADENGGHIEQRSDDQSYYVRFPGDTYPYTFEDLVAKVEYYDESEPFDFDSFAYDDGIVEAGATGATGASPQDAYTYESSEFPYPHEFGGDNAFGTKTNFIMFCQINLGGKAVPHSEFSFACETTQYNFTEPYNLFYFIAGRKGFIEWAEKNGATFTSSENTDSIVASFGGGQFKVEGAYITNEPTEENEIVGYGGTTVDKNSTLGKKAEKKDCKKTTLISAKSAGKPLFGEYARYGYSRLQKALEIRIIREGQPMDIQNMNDDGSNFQGSQWFYLEANYPRDDGPYKTLNTYPAKDGKPWVRPDDTLFNDLGSTVEKGTLRAHEHISPGQIIKCPEIFGPGEDVMILAVRRNQKVADLKGGQESNPQGDHILVLVSRPSIKPIGKWVPSLSGSTIPDYEADPPQWGGGQFSQSDRYNVTNDKFPLNVFDENAPTPPGSDAFSIPQGDGGGVGEPISVNGTMMKWRIQPLDPETGLTKNSYIFESFHRPYEESNYRLYWVKEPPLAGIYCDVTETGLTTYQVKTTPGLWPNPQGNSSWSQPDDMKVPVDAPITSRDQKSIVVRNCNEFPIFCYWTHYNPDWPDYLGPKQSGANNWYRKPFEDASANQVYEQAWKYKRLGANSSSNCALPIEVKPQKPLEDKIRSKNEPGKKKIYRFPIFLRFGTDSAPFTQQAAPFKSGFNPNVNPKKGAFTASDDAQADTGSFSLSDEGRETTVPLNFLPFGIHEDLGNRWSNNTDNGTCYIDPAKKKTGRVSGRDFANNKYNYDLNPNKIFKVAIDGNVIEPFNAPPNREDEPEDFLCAQGDTCEAWMTNKNNKTEKPSHVTNAPNGGSLISVIVANKVAASEDGNTVTNIKKNGKYRITLHDIDSTHRNYTKVRAWSIPDQIATGARPNNTSKYELVTFTREGAAPVDTLSKGDTYEFTAKGDAGLSLGIFGDSTPTPPNDLNFLDHKVTVCVTVEELSFTEPPDREIAKKLCDEVTVPYDEQRAFINAYPVHDGSNFTANFVTRQMEAAWDKFSILSGYTDALWNSANPTPLEITNHSPSRYEKIKIWWIASGEYSPGKSIEEEMNAPTINTDWTRIFKNGPIILTKNTKTTINPPENTSGFVITGESANYNNAEEEALYNIGNDTYIPSWACISVKQAYIPFECPNGQIVTAYEDTKNDNTPYFAKNGVIPNDVDVDFLLTPDGVWNPVSNSNEPRQLIFEEGKTYRFAFNSIDPNKAPADEFSRLRVWWSDDLRAPRDGSQYIAATEDTLRINQSAEFVCKGKYAYLGAVNENRTNQTSDPVFSVNGIGTCVTVSLVESADCRDGYVKTQIFKSDSSNKPVIPNGAQVEFTYPEIARSDGYDYNILAHAVIVKDDGSFEYHNTEPLVLSRTGTTTELPDIWSPNGRTAYIFSVQFKDNDAITGDQGEFCKKRY